VKAAFARGLPQCPIHSRTGFRAPKPKVRILLLSACPEEIDVANQQHYLHGACQANVVA
jgi:hypothetical protein